MITIEPGEQIVAVVRKHWFIIVSKALGFVVLAFLPAVAHSFIGLNSSMFSFFYGTFLLFLWVMFFTVWTDYYLDVLYITDKRVVDIEQKGFFLRDIATLRFEGIQDVTIVTVGVIPTMLGFGTLTLQTAAEDREFIIKDIADPEGIRALILSLNDKVLDQPKPVTIV
jgi:hypothetical protein